jgi:hypothetical protein
MHWKKQAKLAIGMVGQDAFDDADGGTAAEKAGAVIKAEVSRREGE